MEKATFAAGCFWGVEERFNQQPGVISTRVGYTGGHTHNPTYSQVCTGQTGHAEAVEVEYDPEKISYGKLVEFFWSIHNPTTLDQQGPDIGSQYRSAIFYHTPEQERIAYDAKEKLNQSNKFNKPLVTEIVPAGNFYYAEEYHQRYIQKQGKGNCGF